uniref:Uncharacterized protein n=1 Tax=Arundo donax TaxID=35708 RepID=A0A0A9FST8_ARUDO
MWPIGGVNRPFSEISLQRN